MRPFVIEIDPQAAVAPGKSPRRFRLASAGPAGAGAEAVEIVIDGRGARIEPRGPVASAANADGWTTLGAARVRVRPVDAAPAPGAGAAPIVAADSFVDPASAPRFFVQVPDQPPFDILLPALKDEQIIIGRSSTLDPRHVVDHPTVSSQHVRAWFDGTDYWIENLSSVNAVYLNGRKVEGRRRMAHNETYKLGRTTLQFSDAQAMLGLRGASESRSALIEAAPSVSASPAAAPSDARGAPPTGAADEDASDADLQRRRARAASRERLLVGLLLGASAIALLALGWIAYEVLWGGAPRPG